MDKIDRQGSFIAVVRRRSGRRVTDLRVVLEKPPQDYVASEQLTIQMDGRDIPAHVEIPISKHNHILYVA